MMPHDPAAHRGSDRLHQPRARGWIGGGRWRRPSPPVAPAAQRGRGRVRSASAAPSATPRSPSNCGCKLDSSRAAPVPRRNPFVFGSRRAERRARRRRAPARARRGHRNRRAAPAPPPRVPAFKLSGIGIEREGRRGRCCTAIVIADGSMVFAKAGDKLSAATAVVDVAPRDDRRSLKDAGRRRSWFVATLNCQRVSFNLTASSSRRARPTRLSPPSPRGSPPARLRRSARRARRH